MLPLNNNFQESSAHVERESSRVQKGETNLSKFLTVSVLLLKTLPSRSIVYMDADAEGIARTSGLT